MPVTAIIDLRSRFGDIRDQGKRPTCMAFAASDAHSSARNSVDPLSTEYAYFHAVAKRRHSDRTTGVSMQAMAEALSLNGQPLESGWPYIPLLADDDNWEPPKDPGELFYRDVEYPTAIVTSLYDRLNAGQPTIVGMEVSISFFQLASGHVVDAPATEAALGTHAVIVVGHGESKKRRCLLLRNSWGVAWGDDGYGWVMEDYLRPRLLIAGAMKA